MAISDNYVPLRQAGNNVTTQFSSGWNMIAAAYALVFLEDSVTGVQTAVPAGPGAGQYTLAFSASGFTVTYGTAPPVGKIAVVGRAVALDQTDPYKTSKGFQGPTIEASFDKLTAIAQDQDDSISRSIKFPLSDTASSQLPSAIARAGFLLGFDVNGNLTLGTISSGTLISAAMTPVVGASTLELARNAMLCDYIASLTTVFSTATLSAMAKTIQLNADSAGAGQILTLPNMINLPSFGSGQQCIIFNYGTKQAWQINHNSGAVLLAALNPGEALVLAREQGNSQDGNYRRSILSAYTAGQVAGFRNAVINGNMSVWQRNTSYALATGTAYGSADRWAANMVTAAAGIFNRDASVPAGLGVLYSAKLGRNNGSALTNQIAAFTSLETINSLPLAGKQVTFSFYAKAGANFSAASSVLTAYIMYGTGVDQSASLMNTGGWTGFGSVSTSPVLTTSWQRFQVTTTLPSNITQVGCQFNYTPVGTAGADDNIYFTGVQIEQGSQATPFEHRSFGQELALCQRYYEKGFPYVEAPVEGGSGYFGNGGGLGLVAYAANTIRTIPVPFSAEKRVTPTITLFRPSTGATAGTWQYFNTAWANITSNTVSATTKEFVVAGSPVVTIDKVYMIDGNWTASAEL